MGQVKSFNDIIADYLKQRAEESSVELDTYQTESGESYAVLRVNDLADDNAMLEFAVIGKEFDVLKLAFLGRMKG